MLSSLTTSEAIVASVLALVVIAVSIIFFATLIMVVIRRERTSSLVNHGEHADGKQKSLGEFFRSLRKK
jgi:hypothetical protein